MGDVNDEIFIQKYAADLKGPYLEVGSKDYGNTQDIKRIAETLQDHDQTDRQNSHTDHYFNKGKPR